MTVSNMKRAIAFVAGVCAAPGLVAAAFAMYLGWNHNPQGEFHELAADGKQLIHWGPCRKSSSRTRSVGST